MDRRIRELQRKYQQEQIELPTTIRSYIRSLERAVGLEEDLSAFKTAYWEQPEDSDLDSDWVAKWGQPLRGSKEKIYVLNINWFLKKSSKWVDREIPAKSEVFHLFKSLSGEYEYISIKLKEGWSGGNNHRDSTNTFMPNYSLYVPPPPPQVIAEANIIIPAYVYEGHGYLDLPITFTLTDQNLSWQYRYVDKGKLNARKIPLKQLKIMINDHVLHQIQDIPSGGIAVSGRTQVKIFNENVANNMQLEIRFRVVA